MELEEVEAGGPEPDRERLLELARESLRGHLGAAGLHPWEEGDRVWIGVDELWCRIHAGDPIRHPGLWLVPFWFELALDADGREVVRESMAGMGPTPEEAAVHVSHDWVETVFPPVRMMLDPEFCDERVRVLDLASMDAGTGETTAWTMFAGPPLFFGAHAGTIAEALERQPPVSLVLDQVTGSLHLRRRHWVKTFLTRFGGTVEGEVRIDNEQDDEALASLMRFQWPPVDGLAGFRQFLIMRPEPASAQPRPELKAQLRDLVGGAPPADTRAEPPPEPRRPWWKIW